MRTCAQFGVPPLPYLAAILTTLATCWSMSRLEELLPHRWSPPVSMPALQPAEGDRHATKVERCIERGIALFLGYGLIP